MYEAIVAVVIAGVNLGISYAEKEKRRKKLRREAEEQRRQFETLKRSLENEIRNSEDTKKTASWAITKMMAKDITKLFLFYVWETILIVFIIFLLLPLLVSKLPIR